MQSPFIVEITEQNFRETLEGVKVNTPVLIHFWMLHAQPESAQMIAAMNAQTLAQQYNGAFTLS